MNKKVVCFDFDGVIAKYDGWQGFDVFGEPIQETIEVIRRLKIMGCYITIFTTRLDTPILRKWLNDHSVPFDSINSNSHNPEHTSCKPIYHCMVDDRAIGYKQQDVNELYSQIMQMIGDVSRQENE